MTFEAVLAQVLELLQRQGWASYPTLQRRFGLDEEMPLPPRMTYVFKQALIAGIYVERRQDQGIALN